MNITLDDLINDFPNEENTIIKMLYYESKNFEQQSNHNFKLLEKSRAQAIEQQVIIDGLNSALAETTRQFEALKNATISEDSNNHIRQMLADQERYKQMIKTLEDTVNTYKEGEQALLNRILQLGNDLRTKQELIDEMDVEYQGLSVKYDLLMQNSILPSEG